MSCRRVLVAFFVCIAASCDSPSPRPGPVADIGPAPQPARVEPAIPIRARPAPRAPTDQEKLFSGTWVAKVGANAPRSAAVDGKVVLGMEPGKDVVDGVVKAIEDDTRVSTACVWLELYENLHGFRNECALVGGEPSALQKNDVFTGAVQPFGVAFTWRVEDGAVLIDYDEALVVSDGKGGTVSIERARLGLEAGSGPTHRITQTFPEHPDLPPQIDSYEILSGGFLGDPPKP